MLTRLKVSGFKNLVDVDIRFRPVGSAWVNWSSDQSLSIPSDGTCGCLIERQSVRDGHTRDVQNLLRIATIRALKSMPFDEALIWDSAGGIILR